MDGIWIQIWMEFGSDGALLQHAAERRLRVEVLPHLIVGNINITITAMQCAGRVRKACVCRPGGVHAKAGGWATERKRKMRESGVRACPPG